jgi:hypothetical protein
MIILIIPGSGRLAKANPLGVNASTYPWQNLALNTTGITWNFTAANGANALNECYV